MADTIEKGLKNIADELVKLNKNSESGPSPAAQKQADEDKKVAAEKTNTLLATIASNTGGVTDTGKGGASSEDKKLGGMFGGSPW